MIDDPTDTDIARLAAKLGAPIPREVSRRINGHAPVRYETVLAGYGDVIVMRIAGTSRKHVARCGSRAQAESMIRMMEAGDKGAAE